MRGRTLAAGLALGAGTAVLAALAPACKTSPVNDVFTNPDGGESTLADGGGSGDATSTHLPPPSDDGGANKSPQTQTDGGVPCPTGLTCNVTCTGAATTSISGKVYDPAMRNPLYGVAVYVPATSLVPLPKGVPTGADACSCGALYRSGAVVNTLTDETGSFTLTNVPVGTDVPLVIQIGKWRRLYRLKVNACTDNAQPDQSLAFLGTIPAGDTNDSIPDIAVSTGSADTLECLMLRIGIPASEYVAGAGAGHIHVFAGGDPSGLGSGKESTGAPETPGMLGAPASSTSLWDKQDDLMPYDILLLSCEGGETFDANPPVLEAYLNAGGRAFGSHFHYSWFSGPIASGQSYAAPSDWGNNLATWTADTKDSNGPIGGIVDTTLNATGKSFQKGTSLEKWLTNVGALGQGVAAGELPIYSPRYNATVSAANTPSQPWITADSTGQAGATMYFSFDTPANAPAPSDGGSPAYCGRAVFSDLHVSGAVTDLPSPPAGCLDQALTPQEKALEFMLFDLSSCVVPDVIDQSPDAGLPGSGGRPPQ